MKRLITYTSLIAGIVPLLLMTILGATPALSEPITLRLLADKKVYQPAEPIKMQIEVLNESGQSVITRKGFWEQNFHLMITFTDPDGKPVNSSYLQVGAEPAPSYRVGDRDAVFAEQIQNAAIRTIVIDDAHILNSIAKNGIWHAQIFSSIETFSQSDNDPSGNLIAYTDDPQKQTYSLASNKVPFEILSAGPVVRSSVEVSVDLFEIGTGSKPPAKKKPLENVNVRLFRRSEIPADYQPINWKTYPLIWEYCRPVSNGSALTNSKGVAKFDGIEKDDYIVIAYYSGSDDFKHMGSPIDANDPDWSTGRPIQKYLMVMKKADGKEVPGKTTKKTGSLLLIIEPEFVEWSSSRELYPFVFETEGEWGIVTSVSPPEGFVADHKSLSADVSNEVEVLQFTITDVGSRWEEAEVTHKIKHKGTTEIIRSKIGIKLSQKLAKKKGLGIFGHTEDPGEFQGGKKINKNNGGKE